MGVAFFCLALDSGNFRKCHSIFHGCAFAVQTVDNARYLSTSTGFIIPRFACAVNVWYFSKPTMSELKLVVECEAAEKENGQTSE